MDYNIFKKSDNENEEQYLWRIGNIIQTKDTTWADINGIINKELYGDDKTKYKDESAHRKKYQAAVKFKENVFNFYGDDEHILELKKAKEEFIKEKIKVQTERNEYMRYIRSDARSELLFERLVNAISNSERPTPPPVLNTITDTEKGHCLMITDAHYGTKFKIHGLKGEIINEYSPEIFKSRMEKLFNDVLRIIKKEDIKVLNIYELGDQLDGILRVSQLKMLKEDLVEATISYAKYMCEWLNKLSYYVKIRYQATNGNHTELRLLGAPKNSFKNENMGYIIKEFIKTTLKDNKNFEFLENKTSFIYDTVAGFNIFGLHGEVKDMAKAIKDFADIYDIKINFLIAGHYHHVKTEEVGFNTSVINVGSVIGVDEYSMDIRKASNPSCTLICLEEGKGKTVEYTIKLN